MYNAEDDWRYSRDLKAIHVLCAETGCAHPSLHDASHSRRTHRASANSRTSIKHNTGLRLSAVQILAITTDN